MNFVRCRSSFTRMALRLRLVVSGLAISGLAIGISAVGCEEEEPPPSDAQADTGNDSTIADTGSEEGGGEGAVPTQPAALLSWLENESYEGWPAEANSHASSGNHFGKVRTFLSPSLAASLQVGNASHPVGAAAVKEILDESTGELRGWAVSVKTQPAVGPEAWFWFDHVDGVQLVAEQASPVCTGCHSSGADSVRTPWP